MTEEKCSPVGVDLDLSAWVDESIHLDVGSGLYIMAATVGDNSECSDIRRQLHSLVHKPRRRIHWRDEEPKDRLKIAHVIAGFNLVTCVVIGSPVEPKRQERARRKCTEQLFHHLDEYGVTRVFIEARTPQLNRQDRHMIDAMRGRHSIPAGIRADFVQPLNEPMLWVADAVAGAVGAAKKGWPEYHEPLKCLLDEHFLELK